MVTAEQVGRVRIIEALTEAVIVADSGGRIVLANPPAHLLLGRAEGTLDGGALGDLFPAVADGTDESRFEWSGGDGPSTVLEVQRTHWTDPDGSELAVLTLRPASPWFGDAPERPERRFLRALTGVTARLGSRPSLGLILEIAIDTLVVEFGAQLARVWLRDPQGEGFRLHATGTPGASPTLRVAGETEPDELPPEVREVAIGGMPFFVERLASDGRFDSGWVARHGLDALIALPLTVAGERHGVLVAGLGHEPGDEYLDALIGLASILSASLNDMHLLARELTARMEAEAEHRRFQSIIELIPVGVVLATGPEGRVSLVNPAGLRIWGRPLPRVALEEFAALVPVHRGDGQPLPAADRPLWRAFHGGSEVRETLRYDHPDGSRRVLEIVARPFPGPVGGAIATYHDVTERDQLQSDLAVRAAQLKALLDHLPVGVAYFDERGRCLACNGPASRILGRRRPEPLEADAAELFAAAPEIRDALNECIASGEPHARLNAPWVEGAVGRHRFFDWRFEPLRTGPNRPTGVLALIVDVTSRKRTADAMQAARDAAEQSARSKARFLSAISHDLRTPVNALSLLAKVLVEVVACRSPDEELGRISDDLARASSNLVELVDDLLDLTRFDSGENAQHPVEFGLGDWLRATLDPLTITASQKGLGFCWRIDGPDRRLVADRVKLGRVLTNLVGNAIKFTDAGAVEVVTQLSDDGTLTLVVSDTGPGIPDGQSDRIFDEFAQLRNPERDRTKGTGLGLAICRRLVEAVDGRLTVRSEIGAGTRFTVVYPVRALPVVGAAAAAADDHQPDRPLAGAARDGERPSLLLVEDDEVTRQTMIHLLELSGYEVRPACDGTEALAALASRRPSLVLLDLMMPRMDGVEVLRSIRNDPGLAGLPVLVLSGDVLHERQAQLAALDVSATLAKPIDFDELLGVLGRFLEPSPTS